MKIEKHRHKQYQVMAIHVAKSESTGKSVPIIPRLLWSIDPKKER